LINGQSYTVRMYVPDTVQVDTEDHEIRRKMHETIHKMLDFAAVYNLGQDSKKGGTVVGLSLSKDGKSITKRTNSKTEERTSKKDVQKSLSKKREKHAIMAEDTGGQQVRSQTKVSAIDRILNTINDIEKEEKKRARGERHVRFDEDEASEALKPENAFFGFDEVSDEDVEPVKKARKTEPKTEKQRLDPEELDIGLVEE
jgi:hypothetical protein